MPLKSDDGMHFDMPAGEILPLDEVDIRLDPAPHPLEAGRSAAIEANWQREREARPALFDGRMVLLSGLTYRNRRLAGRCHAVRYATFLYWRARRVDGAGHVYAQAVLAGRDGALLAIRMGRHTINAGRVYFASGSFEPGDVLHGRIDVEANMRREVAEETGYRLADARREAAMFALSRPEGTVIFRRYVAKETAAALAARVRAHVQGQHEPEIEEPVIIRNARDLPGGLMPQMPALIDWHFATAAAG